MTVTLSSFFVVEVHPALSPSTAPVAAVEEQGRVTPLFFAEIKLLGISLAQAAL